MMPSSYSIATAVCIESSKSGWYFSAIIEIWGYFIKGSEIIEPLLSLSEINQTVEWKENYCELMENYE